MSRLSATRVTSDTSAPPCMRSCKLAAMPSLSSCPTCRTHPKFSPNCSDLNVKVIRNARNFGHVRSPMHALLQTRGDAVIVLMSDLQDPPEVLAQLLRSECQGYPQRA